MGDGEDYGVLSTDDGVQSTEVGARLCLALQLEGGSGEATPLTICDGKDTATEPNSLAAPDGLRCHNP
jgi:hypothetical protein